MKKLSVLLAAILILLLASPTFAVPVQWISGAGANGHWYEVMPLANASWATAATDAQSKAYYLATITTAEEQAFIQTLLGVPNSSDPIVEYWIGGQQTSFEPSQVWEWYNGEGTFWNNGPTALYSNWANGEPNNNPAPEDHLAMDDRFTWKWNDNDASIQGIIVGYVAERSAPVPEPATMLLLASGLAGLAGFRKRFKKG